MLPQGHTEKFSSLKCTDAECNFTDTAILQVFYHHNWQIKEEMLR